MLDNIAKRQDFLITLNDKCQYDLVKCPINYFSLAVI